MLWAFENGLWDAFFGVSVFTGAAAGSAFLTAVRFFGAAARDF